MGGCERDQAGMAVLYTLPDGRPVWGVASIDDELFVVREAATRVEVYRYATLHRRLDVPGLAAARDLAASHRHACLYITDVGDTSNADPRHRYAIHRSLSLSLSLSLSPSFLSYIVKYLDVKQAQASPPGGSLGDTSPIY